MEIIVRTVNGENAMRYMDGDAVVHKPVGHQWGTHESLMVWKAAGLPESEWPGGFVIVTLTDIPEEKAKALIAEGANIRRAKKIDYVELERRDPQDARATLYSEKRITRAWSEVSDKVKVKP